MLQKCYICSMSVTRVNIKNASKFLFTGHFGLISKYIPGRIKISTLPIPVIVVDEETNEEFEADLISVIGFKDIIPELFCHFFEGKSPEEVEKELLPKYKISSVNHLGFYTYALRSQNSN